MTRDARLSALHRGGFGPRGRASVSFGARRPTTAGSCLPDPCSDLLAARSLCLAGGVPGLPGRTVTSRRRRTPLLAPPSGCLRTTPLKERGCECLAQTLYVV